MEALYEVRVFYDAAVWHLQSDRLPTVRRRTPQIGLPGTVGRVVRHVRHSPEALGLCHMQHALLSQPLEARLPHADWRQWRSPT